MLLFALVVMVDVWLVVLAAGILWIAAGQAVDLYHRGRVRYAGWQLHRARQRYIDAFLRSIGPRPRDPLDAWKYRGEDPHKW